MSQQQPEVNVERVVGRIEAGLTWMAKRLEDHTAQDHENFQALNAKLDAVLKRLETIDLARANHARDWKWVVGISSIVSTVVGFVVSAL